MTKARNNADNVSGDISEVTAGTGISVSNGTGPAPAVALTTPVASTNGGTGLSSFTTGDIIYSSSGNTLSKLGIGTTSQVLTVAGGLPSWAAASSGGMTLLSTTSLTSGGSVTISTIDQTYKNLLVIGIGMTASMNTDWYMRFNSDTNSNYATFQVSYVDTTLSGSFANSTSIGVSAMGTSTSNVNAGYFNLQIYRYAESSEYKNAKIAARAKSSVNVGRLQEIAYGSNTAISSITLGLDGGTWTTGTVYIYGEK